MTVSLVAGELAMVSVRKVDKAMLVNGNTCADTAAALTGAALTTKVKTIAIGPKVAGGLNGGTQTVILDNRNGTFALAAATSGGIAIDLGTGASNEVAVVGSTAADKYGCIKVTGKDTLGLKTATSSDVTMVNPVSKYTIDLNDGDDSFDQGDCPTAMSITGGAGKDTFIASATVVNKGDTYIGGTGVDTLDYSKRVLAASIPVSVTLDGVANDGYSSENDLVNSDVEIIKGSAGNDTFVGPTALSLTTTVPVLTGTVYTFSGGDGDDTFTTYTGAGVIINGGNGTDTVDYSARATTVTATMDGSKADDGEAKDTDNIGKDVENFKASSHGDTVTGNAMNNTFTGGAGNDKFTGGAGDDTFIAKAGGASGTSTTSAIDGCDSFIGGDGNDTIDYSAHYASTGGSSTYGVVVTLDGKATSGWSLVTTTGSGTSTAAVAGTLNVGDTDTIGADVENAIGTPNRDYIIGNASVNTLVGFGGNDWVVGGAANDQIDLNAYYARTPNGYLCGPGPACVTIPGGSTVDTSHGTCDCTGSSTNNDVCNPFTGATISHTATNIACSGNATTPNVGAACAMNAVHADCGSDPLDVVSCAAATSTDAAGASWATYPTCWKVQL